jgi:hypothetical protein
MLRAVQSSEEPSRSAEEERGKGSLNRDSNEFANTPREKIEPGQARDANPAAPFQVAASGGPSAARAAS